VILAGQAANCCMIQAVRKTTIPTANVPHPPLI
jgi:hypothetical protein